MFSNIKKFAFAVWLSTLVFSTAVFLDVLAMNAMVKQCDILVARAHGVRHVP